MGVGLLSQVTSDRGKRKWAQVMPGEAQVGYYEKFLHRKGCQALLQIAHGNGGMTIPGGI